MERQPQNPKFRNSPEHSSMQYPAFFCSGPYKACYLTLKAPRKNASESVGC